MAKRSPNAEQKIAIEHFGGKLLSAGAGSGKTFVLVEHIIFLTQQYLEKNSFPSIEEKEMGLRQYLSKIVLMTFTKKAAGELSARLAGRVEEADEFSTEDKELVKSALSRMTVGTIHGFCFKLLHSGLILGVDISGGIVDEISQRKKIESIFKRWLEKEIGRQKDHHGDLFLSIVSANLRSFLESITSVFASPELRMQWHRLTEQDFNFISLEDFFESYKKLAGLGELDSPPDFSPLSDMKKKAKWVDFVQNFAALYRQNSFRDDQSLQKFRDFFNENTRIVSPKGEDYRVFADYLKVILKLRDFLKAEGDSLMAYQRNQSGKFRFWFDGLLRIFSAIEEQYQREPGVTFSDLEYYVHRGLHDAETAHRIQEHFNYFIIDEFQDTSTIQFEILELLCGRDYSKLYCVGDVKQAIYGFRGGELGVFLDCAQKIDENLNLTSNYRSHQNIIEMNNRLFTHLFPLANGFEGEEENPVEVVPQTIPSPDVELGILKKISVDLELGEGEKAPSKAASLDFLESVEIVTYLKDKKEAEVCILYKKLTPTKFLVPMLIDAGIGFTAQMKVPHGEDPIWALFTLLIEESLSEERELNYLSHLIRAYMSYVGIDIIQEVVRINTEQFFRDQKTMGLTCAFKAFLSGLGIANSNYQQNLNVVDNICRLGQGRPEEIWNLIQPLLGEKFSIDFQHGENPEKVIILTAHGSKGLEFEEVILGGIHSNGLSMSDHSYFGKWPGSYKWKEEGTQKKAFKSPELILEEQYQKRKEFAESKRLFYVATTRAQRQLTWFDLECGGKPLKFSGDSWIVGLRHWENTLDAESLPILKSIKESMVSKTIRTESLEFAPEQFEDPKPLFHQDSLGLVGKGVGPQYLGLAAELSVTRLATLEDCPRKFYLKNICQLDETLPELLLDRMEEEKISEELSLSDEIGVPVFKSSAERGTRIHQLVSDMILNQMIIPVEVTDKNDRKIFEWLKEVWSELPKEMEFVSEEPVKFSLFGQMISGTPDLYLRPPANHKNCFEVWDFKTGQRSETKEKSYWFQLKCYAYAAYSMGILSPTAPAQLVLAYLDQKDLVKREYTFETLQKELFQTWSRLRVLDQTELVHCPHCPYQNICQLSPAETPIELQLTLPMIK